MGSLRRRLLAGLVLGFIVALGLALFSDIRQVRAHLAAFPWSLIPLILAGTLFNYSLRFIKWHYYLGQIGAHNLSVWKSAQLFVAGFPLAISDGLAVLLLSTLGVVAYRRYWPVFAIILTLLIAGIILSQIRPIALWALDTAERLPFLKRVSHHLREFYEGTYTLFRPRSTLIAVGLGTIAWLGEGIAMYLVLLGLGVPAGWHTLSIAVFTLSFSTVIGAVSTLPGGLGAVEVSMTGMLILLLDLPASTATAATLIIRFATLWFGVGLGLSAWLFSKDLLLLESSQPEPAEAA
jgi:uncharacterized protein (TIRG00374 family)